MQDTALRYPEIHTHATLGSLIPAISQKKKKHWFICLCEKSTHNNKYVDGNGNGLCATSQIIQSGYC